MTQMVGCALYGEKAGGTKEACVVSFFDDWNDKIAWIPPKKRYAFGMPRIKITQEFGNHAVTIEEFMEIYQIFDKYSGKTLFEL